jgi:hypothetical protein
MRLCMGRNPRATVEGGGARVAIRFGEVVKVNEVEVRQMPDW